MSSNIDTKELCKWCVIPAEQLENHPDSKVAVRVFNDKNEVPVVAGT